MMYNNQHGVEKMRKPVILLLLVILAGLFASFILLKLLGIDQRPSPQLEVMVFDMMTGKDIQVDSETIKLVDPTVEFEAPVSKVFLCYTLKSSAPFTVTYRWMFMNSEVLQREASVDSGIVCTSMQKDALDGFPEGSYLVDITAQGVLLGRMSFIIRAADKSG
jgi:hypothetical protein